MIDQWEVMDRHRRKAPVCVRSVAEDLGIAVREGRWRGEYSGLIRAERKFVVFRRFAIIVNEAHSPARQRFTIAHEIGHWVYHREYIGDGVTDDSLYRSRLRSPWESQANAFAAWLLMPWSLVAEQVGNGADSVAELAEIFEVSKSAMSIRLQVPFETG